MPHGIPTVPNILSWDGVGLGGGGEEQRLENESYLVPELNGMSLLNTQQSPDLVEPPAQNIVSETVNEHGDIHIHKLYIYMERDMLALM